MSNVIQWAEAGEALKVIADEQKLVAGMTVAEAAAALKYTKTAGGMYLKTVITNSAASTVAGSSAAGVASSATTGAATSTAVNLTLVEGTGAAAGTAQVAGIGSIALPIAACIAGAAGGYLIGKELNKNPAYSSFWDNLVFKTADFVTGQSLADELINENNAPTVPILYDVNGATYLPSALSAEVIAYLDSFSATINPNITYNDYQNIEEVYQHYHITEKLPVKPYYLAVDNNNWLWIYASDYPYTVQATLYSRGSNTWYGLGVGMGGMDYTYNKFSGAKKTEHTGNYHFIGNTVTRDANRLTYQHWVEAPNNTSSSNIYFCTNPLYFKGVLVHNPTGAPSPLPEEVTKYTPVTAPATLPDPNGNTWSQVYLPSTPPTEMPDGEPVPETAPDPIRITPYIPPYQPQPAEVPILIPDVTPVNPITIPNPMPDTSPAPYPNPNPASDPSAETDPVSQPVQEPIPDPVSTGTPTVPVVPSAPLPSSAKGLLHVYNPTPTQVDQFGEWLWTTFSGDIIDTIGKLFNNPMDAVIGLHEIYCTPTDSTTDVNIRAGFLESNVPSRLVTSRYTEIKCGALWVPEYWGNYLDYSPYTKSYCYLPFIGIVELNTDDIVGSGVEITYRIDVYNGSCIAIITTAKPNSAESVTYQFEGNCAVSVPITSGMMSAVQNALIGVATTALSAGATAAVTVATGGTALPAAVLAGSVAAGATKQGLTSKNQVQHSGSFGSSYGAMGLKKPFLIIKRPRQKVVYGYNTNYGYPAHKMVLISTCTGYLRAKEVDVISPTATEAEKKMIEQMLKSGVFVD